MILPKKINLFLSLSFSRVVLIVRILFRIKHRSVYIIFFYKTESSKPDRGIVVNLKIVKKILQKNNLIQWGKRCFFC
jgi:hypothetical protein